MATILCVSLGWYVDRQMNSNHVNSMLEGSVTWHWALKLDHLNREGQTEIPTRVQSSQVEIVFDLYRFSEHIEAFLAHLDYNDSVASLTRDALSNLDCASADEYFDRFEQRWESDVYQEFKAGGAEHARFRRFLENSLED